MTSTAAPSIRGGSAGHPGRRRRASSPIRPYPSNDAPIQCGVDQHLVEIIVNISSILWLRRDLRIHDHPALEAARRHADALVPVFCFDDRLLHGRHASGPRTQFLLECLADLDESLRKRGSRLVVRRGRPEQVIPQLARDTGATAVHLSADVGPFARARDARVESALDVPFHQHPGTFVLDDLDAIRTTAGNPYTVFTPFHRTWARTPRRERHGAPRSLPSLPSGLDPGRTPSLHDLGLTQEIDDPRCRGGENAGRKAMRDGRSPLSPYLHFGCLSPRELEDRTPDSEVRRQLCWRDFFAHVLLHHPRNARSEHQARYRGHDPVEPRAQTVRGVVRGTHRLSAGRRRHAPAQARRLHRQPSPPRRRLVPDQGSRDRLALGRAVVHAPAARRRRGQQQRQLAVDRVGRRRPAAGVAPDPQPGPAAGQARPGRQLRPPLRPRAPQGRERLPGADRRSRPGTPRGARPLRRRPAPDGPEK